MCVRCLCMHVCIQLYKILCMHADLNFMYLWMHACIHVHMYVCSVCVRARACMRVFIFVSYDLRCARMHACMHVGPMHYVGKYE